MIWFEIDNHILPALVADLVYHRASRLSNPNFTIAALSIRKTNTGITTYHRVAAPFKLERCPVPRASVAIYIPFSVPFTNKQAASQGS